MTPQYTIDFVDVTEFVKAEKIPEKVLKRGADDVWNVCKVPVEAGTSQIDATAWALVRDGELVRIPLVPYVVEADAAYTVAAAVERGLYIGQLVKTTQPPIRVHIIIGRPVEHLDDDDYQYRFWLGFAIQTK
jgi:hypothetical protein